MTLLNNFNVHESAQAEVGSVRARNNRTLLIDARAGDMRRRGFSDSRVESFAEFTGWH